MWLFVSVFFPFEEYSQDHPCCSMYQSFPSSYGWIVFHCRDITHLFIHSSIGRHLGCFHYCEIYGQIFAWTLFSILFDTYLRVELGVICYMFNIWGNFQAVFHSGYAILHPHPQCMTDDDEHLFMWLLSICVSFLKNYLSRSFAHCLVVVRGEGGDSVVWFHKLLI